MKRFSRLVLAHSTVTEGILTRTAPAVASSRPVTTRPLPALKLQPIHLLSTHLRSASMSTTANTTTTPAAAETDTQAQSVANTSGITPSSLQKALVERLEARFVDVEDMSGGCGQSFQASIVSPLFANKTTLARHRLVNAALKEEIKAIHAWTPRCFTPEEWEKRGGS